MERDVALKVLHVMAKQAAAASAALRKALSGAIPRDDDGEVVDEGFSLDLRQVLRDADRETAEVSRINALALQRLMARGGIAEIRRAREADDYWEYDSEVTFGEEVERTEARMRRRARHGYESAKAMTESDPW